MGGEDFFDLSGVLQSGHGYFVRDRFWFEARCLRDKLPNG